MPRSPIRTYSTVSSPASPSRKGSPIFSPLPSPQTSAHDSPILASHFGSPPRPAHSPLNSPLPSPLPASRMHYDPSNPNHPPPMGSPPRKYGSPISSPLPSPKDTELLTRSLSASNLREVSSNNLLAELEDASISSLKSPDASLSRSESLSPLHALPRFHFPAGVSRAEDHVAVPIILERFEQHPQVFFCFSLVSQLIKKPVFLGFDLHRVDSGHPADWAVLLLEHDAICRLRAEPESDPRCVLEVLVVGLANGVPTCTIISDHRQSCREA